MNKKICNKCNIEKNIDDFYKKRIRKDGKIVYRNECKECKLIYAKSYLSKNHDNIKKYKRSYYKKNQEELLKKQSKYKKDNIEKIRQYYKTPEGKRLNQAMCSKRRALKRNTKTINIGKKLLTKMYNKQNGKCNYCNILLDFNIKYFVHLDHIIPLSKGGTHTIDNLQYLCQKCNLIKGDKIIC